MSEVVNPKSETVNPKRLAFFERYLTVWVLVEKLAPFGERTSALTGVALLALSVWVLLR